MFSLVRPNDWQMFDQGKKGKCEFLQADVFRIGNFFLRYCFTKVKNLANVMFLWCNSVSLVGCTSLSWHPDLTSINSQKLKHSKIIYRDLCTAVTDPMTDLDSERPPCVMWIKWKCLSEQSGKVQTDRAELITSDHCLSAKLGPGIQVDVIRPIKLPHTLLHTW